MPGTTEDGGMLYYVSRMEMGDHLLARFNHHVKRNEELLAEAEALNDELEEELAEQSSVTDRMRLKASNSYTSNASRRDQLKSGARTHAQKATVMKFYYDHLPAENGFLLSSTELIRLEFTPSVF